MDTDIFIEQSPSDLISQIKFAHGSLHFVVSSWDLTVRVFDGATGDLLKRFDMPVPIANVAYNLNNSLLIAGGINGIIFGIDLVSDEIREVGVHPIGISGMKFNTHTNTLFTSDWSGHIYEWVCESLNEIAIKRETKSERKILCFDSFGSNLVAINVDNCISIYNANNIIETPVLRASPLPKQISNVCVGDSESYVVVAIDGRVAVEYFDISQEKRFAFKSHKFVFNKDKSKAEQDACLYSINAVAFNTVKGLLVTGGMDGTASSWNLSRRKREATTETFHTGVNCIAISDDGELVVLGISHVDALELEQRPVDCLIIKKWETSFIKVKK